MIRWENSVRRQSVSIREMLPCGWPSQGHVDRAGYHLRSCGRGQTVWSIDFPRTSEHMTGPG